MMMLFSENEPFENVQHSVGDSNKLSVSIANHKALREDFKTAFNIDVDDKTKSLLYSELKQSLYRKVIQSMVETKSYLFEDYRGENDLQIGNRFCDMIVYHNIPNVIVSAKMGACIMDSHKFSYTNSKLNNTTGTIYKIGMVSQCTIFVDPMMKFTDDKYLSFEKIDVNISNLACVDSYDETFNPKTEATLSYSFKGHQPKMIYVLMDDSPNPGEFKAHLRNKKINDILNKNPYLYNNGDK